MKRTKRYGRSGYVNEKEITMADKATIIVHSGDMDKLYSALIIANGALSMGMEATFYFTFWGLERLKKEGLELSLIHI